MIFMSKIFYNIYEAKTSLSSIVERAARGEEIIIAKSGHPKAKLVPLHHEKVQRKPGGWEHGFWISDDFDEPLSEELENLFYGEE